MAEIIPRRRNSVKLFMGHYTRSGALSKALISSRERYPTRRRSKRFIGIAMTPRIVPNAVGAINPAYWRKERSAAKRAFRLRIVLRSEEHTSELQSHSDLVCRLLLEKKKIYKRRR